VESTSKARGDARAPEIRLRFEPERRYDHIGFRVVLVQR
jgi:formylglycine-generating enzyme required for sulfatase activity